MLFGTFEFLLAFLPLTLTGYHWLSRAGQPDAARLFLALASLFFYGWWDVAYVPLIAGSIAVNFALGCLIGTRPGARRVALVLGLLFNISLLCYYKYARFFLDNIEHLTGLTFAVKAVVLPIGISFFTFQQVVYLVDAARDGQYERSLVNYSLFILFFPHLIAGPITHPREMLPQFARAGAQSPAYSDIGAGALLLILGLAKKTVIADMLALAANPIFAAADAGAGVSIAAAWLGALAYTFQLYFDFSGYSDMAIGLGLLFGIHLPVNFASPYKATSIVEFWRRWHITLSRFLRNYVYVPLGGNRKGPMRRYLNLMITMALGGLWHGAGWTFVTWGLLHGGYLVVNHGWSRLRRPLPSPIAWGMTFFCVTMGWVLFRATTFSGAMTIIAAMAGFPGTTGVADLPTAEVAWLGVGIAAVIALGLPNGLELVDYARFRPPLHDEPVPLRALAWRPSPHWAAVALGVVTALVIARLPDPGIFLYFNF